MNEKIVVASRPLARVSRKDSATLFRYIRNKPTQKAKNLLNELISRRKNINGRYFTKASKEILDLIKECENNAEAKGLDVERLFVKSAIANKSFSFILPKSRWPHRGRRAKICSLRIELEER
ncbi:MAG: uL22 family ribosomal protein [Candidatus Aenigmatarchaeota archaeon]